ncbi:ABC transporter permease [Sphaerisporangium perillae]|uniref:ABC transporter permease n=1 Tax=Sphaerisporangium perillae TaxID=2935860 RepID=UPI00200D5E9E|nr:FtsX-like permease family protein [Sphaerisporangium perillae]
MRGRTPLVLRRAFSEPLLLFAAFGSILLATTTLVALTMYASSIAEVGVRRAMETASAGTTAIKISAPVQQATFPEIDRTVRARITERVRDGRADVPVHVTLSARSDSYAVPGQEGRKQPDLTRFGVYDGLDQNAKLIQGAWPRPAPRGTVEVALSQAAAQAMNLAAGSEFTVVGRLDHKPVHAKVTGVFQLADPYADRWDGEDLLRKGVDRGNYTTYGPLMVPQETFLGRFTATSIAATWTAQPDLRNLPPERLRPFAASVTALGTDLKRDCPSCTTYTRLPDMLTQLDQAALVARSTMLVPVLQLLLLAAYALVLTARLLADHRRMEVALLRSRGAGSVRLAVLTGTEALLVAVPCAAVAPFLAPALLRLVNAIPWIQAAGVQIAPEPDAVTFAVSAGVALACAVLLALPALRGARRTYVEEQATRGRGDRQGLLERAGGDVALLAVAALAIWQLQHYGAPVTATAGGELGIDPLIVTGPALALLCGGMLGLRLVPRVSRVAERFTSRRPSLSPALGAWQVSRRPMRYSGPALLLTMAVAIGVVSMATATTWRTSQQDQARHQAAADLRVSGPPETPELGLLGRGATYGGLAGVTAVSPVYRGVTSFSGASPTLLAADATKLDRLLMLRPDLSSDSVRTIAGRLAAGRPEAPALELPGTPKKLTMDVRLGLTMPAEWGQYADLRLRVILSDALGAHREVQVGPIVPDGEPHPVTVDLAAQAGRSGRLSYPLSVRGFLLDLPVPARGSGLTMTVEGAKTDSGVPVTMPGALQWGHTVRGEDHIDAHQVTVGGNAQKAPSGSVLLSVTVPAPKAQQPPEPADPEYLAVVAAPAGVPNDALFLPSDQGRIFRPVPVVLTTDLAADEKLTVGKTAMLDMDGEPITIQVAGIVSAMPGTPPGTSAILADLPTLLTRDVFGARVPRPAGEWWMAARDGDTTAAAAELARHPDWDQTVVDIATLTRQLRDDPLASGLQGALILGFVAALIFAVLGFLVNAAVAARERMAEFAILRALGVSFRQIFGLLAVEQTFLIGLSLAGGTLLAVGVASLVVPHIVLTGQAVSVTPSVLLDIPWPATIALLAAVAALLFAIVAGLARSLRRQGLGRALRIGEDR